MFVLRALGRAKEIGSPTTYCSETEPQRNWGMEKNSEQVAENSLTPNDFKPGFW
jgi:hypothetical protein